MRKAFYLIVAFVLICLLVESNAFARGFRGGGGGGRGGGAAYRGGGASHRSPSMGHRSHRSSSSKAHKSTRSYSSKSRKSTKSTSSKARKTTRTSTSRSRKTTTRSSSTKARKTTGSTHRATATKRTGTKATKGQLQNFLDAPKAAAGVAGVAGGALGAEGARRLLEQKPGAPAKPVQPAVKPGRPSQPVAGRPGKPTQPIAGKPGRPAHPVAGKPGKGGKHHRPGYRPPHHRPPHASHPIHRPPHYRPPHHRPPHASHPIYRPGHGHHLRHHWWRHAAWGFAAGWIVGAAFSQPYSYNYGSDIYYDNGYVYMDGKQVASAGEYYDQASELAESAPAVDQEAVKEEEWMSLGVFALSPEDTYESSSVIQLAVSKEGVISGTYYDTSDNSERPLKGMVDKKTQRAAWTYADGKDTDVIYETGLYNLTEDETTAFIHYGKNSTETWRLVRLPETESKSKK